MRRASLYKRISLRLSLAIRCLCASVSDSMRSLATLCLPLPALTAPGVVLKRRPNCASKSFSLLQRSSLMPKKSNWSSAWRARSQRHSRRRLARAEALAVGPAMGSRLQTMRSSLRSPCPMPP
eukprot:scaffold45935_cov24-Tisochrysis_lutea.AAC.4